MPVADDGALRLDALGKDMLALSHRLASLERQGARSFPLGPGLVLHHAGAMSWLRRAGGSVRPLPAGLEQRLALAAPGPAMDLAPADGELALLMARAGFTVEAFPADWPGHHLLCANILLSGADGVSPRPPGTPPRPGDTLALLHLASWPPPAGVLPACGPRTLIILDTAPTDAVLSDAGYRSEAVAPAGPWLACPMA